jgi:Relaxase/Mobilisation nuclease domain/RepB DNA-primase from phage plasmid
MICKRMPMRGDGAPVTRQVEDLLGYVDRAGPEAGRGDLVALGGRNFVSAIRAVQAAEMIATLTGCPRARRPLEHLVLSWRPDEQPDLRQVKEAVAILVRGLGLARHQALWALHGDAAGAHLHLVVARVDPETGRPATIPLFINELDRAVARIEHAQGWQPEANARFRVVDGITKQRRDDDGGRDGYDDFEWERDDAAGHRGRAAHGLGAGGAGGALGDGRDPDDAAAGRGRAGSGRSRRGDRRTADAGRGAGRGDGRRDRGDARHPGRGSRHSGDDPCRAGAGGRARAAAASGRPDVEAAADAVPRHDPDHAVGRLRGRWAALRLRAACWERGLGSNLDWVQPATEPDREAGILRRARARARLATLVGDDAPARIARKTLAVRLRGAHPGRWDNLPLARTLAGADTLSAPAAAREVRRGERSPERVAIEVAGPLIDAAASWPALHAALAQEGIAYRRKGSGAVLLVGGVAVKASTYRKAALGALTGRLGTYQAAPDETTGTVPRRGIEAAPGTDPRVFEALQRDRAAAARASARFAEDCAPLPPTSWRAAALLGEPPRAAPDARAVADRLGLQRPRLAPLARSQPAPVDPGSALDTCHVALRAERYGALIRMPPAEPSPGPETAAAAAGDRARAEPYDRLLQVPLGPLAAVEAASPRIVALARRGASVRLLFAARDQHHVVLRDLDADGLARLRADGHAPALVLEGRPGRFEAVLRAPSGGSTDEPAAVRRVGQTLARRYGCAVSDWGVRVVRAPEPDGTPAEPRSGVAAQFVAWTGEACPRLATLVAQGARRLRALRALLARPMSGSRPGPWWRRVGLAPPTRAEAAIYHAHRRDILAGWEGRRPDNSRVDARIARRLRTTGHGETAVAASIAACAAALAPYRRRDWATYGRRAASLAFAPDAAGGTEVEAGAERVAAWAALERRTRERVAAVAALRSAIARPVEITAPAPAVSPAEVGPGDATVAQPEPVAPAVSAPAIVPPEPVTAPPVPPAIDRPGRIEPSPEQRAILQPQEDRLGALLTQTIAAMRRGEAASPEPFVSALVARRGAVAAEPPPPVRPREIAVPADRPDGRSEAARRVAADPAEERGRRDTAAVAEHPEADLAASRPNTPALGDEPSAAAWNPLTDVPARYRSLASYYVLALASDERSLKGYRPYLRQALGDEIAARAETWHKATVGTPEHRRVLAAVRRWTGPWNFNAVEHACKAAGVRIPGR